jgi:ubiquitin-conjugating enzyme E2 Z
MTEITRTITKETINRLLKDVRNIMKNPLTDNGIYYVHDDEDILKGYAMIVGQSDTPYFGGFYLFKFQYGWDYPYSPPVVTYHTNDGVIRFNPNLYVNGKVCVSILNTWRGEQWTSCQTISTILLTLSTLLCKNPIVNEPGIFVNSSDCNPYTDIIQYSNIKIAICDMIQQKPGVFPNEFRMFAPFMKENFLKNYDAILEFLNGKRGTPVYTQRTRIYSMNISINYDMIYHMFISCKKICQV